MKKFKRRAASEHISSTSWSPFYTYYISFRSLGSQKSNALNSVQIGAETKKLWPLENNRTKLSENFAAAKGAAKPPPSTRVPLRKLKFHLRNCEPRCKIISKLRTKVRNHLQVANQVTKSSLSYE